jgi:thiamine-phosphate pyrophosphorylase
LNAGNTEAAVMAGADGIAVVSAICAAPDPFAASRELDGIIRAALAKRGRLREK